MSGSTKTNRNLSLDLLRVIASIMVVIMHVTSTWKYQNINTFQWRTSIVYDSFCRSAVTIFFMLSGALGRNTDFKKGIKKTSRYILIFLLISLFYSFSDSIISWSYGNKFELMGILSGINNYKYHLWFLPVFIILTLVAPLINRCFESRKGRIIIKWYLILWILGLILRTIQLALSINNTFMSVIVFILALPMIGPYALGRILTENPVSNRQNWLLLFVGIAASLIIGMLTFIYSIKAGYFDDRWMGDITIPILLQAIGWYCFFSTRKVGSSTAKIIESIAPYTLEIYLFHVFFLDWLIRIHIFNDLLFCGIYINIAIQIVLRTLILYTLSLLAAKMISRCMTWLNRKKTY